ncbi:MAG: exosortase E/protease, VPEID-CTERM system [Deltaproteobacteria bacterium]|nr:exosortase E/protease, VPEID-CTERM system [Deltaproteobacteria bacterium]
MGIALLAEYALFSLLFDFGSIVHINSPLRILGYLGTLAPVAAITATVLVLLSGTQLRNNLTKIAAETPFRRATVLWIIHIGSYIGLLLITPKIYGSDAWLIFWIIIACASVTTALFVAMPPVLLRKFIQQSKVKLIVGLIIGIVAWAAGLLAESLWQSLGDITFYTVSILVQLLPGETIVDAPNSIIGTQDFSVMVAPVCSGYQGIGLMTVFIAAFLFFKRKELRFPNALTLLPLAIVLTWVTNALRIFLLIALGVHGREQLALGGFHAKAGWILFCILALAIVAVAQSLSFFSKTTRPSSKQNTDNWNPTTVHLLPFLTAVAVAMIAGIFVDDSTLNVGYPLTVLASMTALVIYRGRFLPIRCSFSWLPVAAGIGVAAVWIAAEHLWVIPYSPPALSPSNRTQSTLFLITWMVFRLGGSCIVIPIIEELAFRGFLLRRLIDSDFVGVPYKQFTWLSFVLSSVAFGLMHGHRFVVGIVAGMAFATVVYRRGKLVDAIVAHMVANITIAAYVVALGQWSLWE